MRRSLCPSQQGKRQSSGGGSQPLSSSTRTRRQADDDEVVIERMPLFGFLEIPEQLHRHFRIPSGCKITQQSVELRKVKSLGPRKVFRNVMPGDLKGLKLTPFQPVMMDCVGDDGDDDVEGSIKAALPPHEPLVLWRESVPHSHCEDGECSPHSSEGSAQSDHGHKIEVN
jgi:hypothetical protein